ncbi:CoA transferase [Pullulanibacillus camelliae]|uniref:CoA transferase n=1 Tax=Pullulanibacillus camelliae TaxID=1707096 RepID=A0A8J3DVU9_9BACL|nr:CaiB/BaiF CoA-transferase family protein [Pullulanibacillus camelliae]GGE45634.1 CoA transferase [Pullulanibacillus camelliae]
MRGEKPLEGMIVLDFSQFLSGPSAALRLADLGARVIKIEREGTGDICRQLYISDLEIDGDSSLFHAINRNKESLAVDLKDPDDHQTIVKLIQKADVLIENFRPGVMKRLGLSYEEVKAINPSIVYGEITGYGNEGPWRDRPGQDLLVQALSGLCYLNGNADQPPLPLGLSIVDMAAGAQLVQGLLAGLFHRSMRQQGCRVQVSLLEAIMDLQFEVFTTFLNDGHEPPQRSQVNNANAYLGAPYGIYETADGYIALAMGSVTELGKLLACPALETYTDPATWFDSRDEIKGLLVDHLKTQKTEYWLNSLEDADYWCAEVFTWQKLLQHEGFKVLKMIQKVQRENGIELWTTRCPIRINGELLTASKGAPRIGEDTSRILTHIR